MGAMTGLLAGLATVGGAIAVARLVTRKAPTIKRALDEARKVMNVENASGDKASAQDPVVGAVLDYEQDAETGVFRVK